MFDGPAKSITETIIGGLCLTLVGLLVAAAVVGLVLVGSWLRREDRGPGGDLGRGEGEGRPPRP